MKRISSRSNFVFLHSSSSRSGLYRGPYVSSSTSGSGTGEDIINQTCLRGCSTGVNSTIAISFRIPISESEPVSHYEFPMRSTGVGSSLRESGAPLERRGGETEGHNSRMKMSTTNRVTVSSKGRVMFPRQNLLYWTESRTRLNFIPL